jgi:hypothetical protein
MTPLVVSFTTSLAASKAGSALLGWRPWKVDSRLRLQVVDDQQQQQQHDTRQVNGSKPAWIQAVAGTRRAAFNGNTNLYNAQGSLAMRLTSPSSSA